MHNKEKINFLNRFNKINGNILIVSNNEDFFIQEIVSSYKKYFLVNIKENNPSINSNLKNNKLFFNLKKTEFSNNFFDLIIFYNYFSEISNKELLECSRILKVDGLIYRNTITLENLFKNIECNISYKNNKNLLNQFIYNYFSSLIVCFPTISEKIKGELGYLIHLIRKSSSIKLFNKFFYIMSYYFLKIFYSKLNFKNQIFLDLLLKIQVFFKDFLNINNHNTELKFPSIRMLDDLKNTNLYSLDYQSENSIFVDDNYFNKKKLINTKLKYTNEVLLAKINFNDYDINFFNNGYEKSHKITELLFESQITNNSNILITKYLEYINSVFTNINEDHLIEYIRNMIIQNYDGTFFYRIYCFVQDSVVKHPVLNYFDSQTLIKPFLILFLGFGKCGNTSLLASYLFKKFGFKSKITQLKNHVICEVLYKGKWRIVDAHFLKFGIFPKNNKNEWASLNDVKNNPLIIDKLPSFNFSILFDKKIVKTITKKDFYGYIDKKDIWSNPFISNYYLNIENKKFPPKPIDILFKLEQNHLYLKSKTKTSDEVFLSLFISSKSRGWRYNRYPDKKFIKPLCSNILKNDINSKDINNGIKIKLKNNYKCIFINTKLKLKKYKDAFYWPQEEIKITNKSK